MISGYQASDIGQYGIGDLSWWQGGDDYVEWGAVPIPVGAAFDIFNPWRDPPARISVPFIPTFVATTDARDRNPETVGSSEVPEPSTMVVIDPDFRPYYTAEESAPIFEPGNEWYERTAPTDWDRVYDQYVILNQEEEVAIDWGELAGQVIGGFFGQQQSPAGAWAPQQITSVTSPPSGPPGGIGITGGGNGMAGNGGNGCGPTGPKYGKICLATGVVTPLRRRRRRRLLTSSDIKDLSALKSIVGGAALQGAVVQAVRR